jgi:fumarylacetoacetase
MLDDTHDPSLRSWVESANDPSTDFRFRIFHSAYFVAPGTREEARIGVAIGDQIIDLAALRPRRGSRRRDGDCPVSVARRA